jgi:hypothetical protein
MIPNDSMSDFNVVLAQIAGGALRDELSDTMRDALLQLEQRALGTSKVAKGIVTLKLALAVEPNGLVCVDGDVITKLPKPLRQQDHFHLTKTGGLSRKNQHQQELQFREASNDVAGKVMEIIDRAKEIKG